MCKFKYIIVFVAFATMMGGYNLYRSSRTFILSDLVLANVEALADNGETNKRKVAIKDTHKREVWDPVEKVIYIVTTVTCEGKGEIIC